MFISTLYVKYLSYQKVRVSETPGKTKHFQTLELTDDITLCDCPGLVMPSLANSKAGMVLQVHHTTFYCIYYVTIVVTDCVLGNTSH